MIGENIRRFRTERGMTQSKLAEQLFVTTQAVSRWENGDVEPSITSVTAIAKIFGVTVDQLLNDVREEANKSQSQTKSEAEGGSKSESGSNSYLPKLEVKKDENQAAPQAIHTPKPVLAVCENCNKPIFDPKQIVRKSSGDSKYVYCKDCVDDHEKAVLYAKIEKEENARNTSFVVSSIVAVIALIVTIVALRGKPYFVPSIILSVALFPFISCCFLNNNCVGDIFLDIVSWSFIRLPGLIFTLDLDGIIWLLTVKLCFWILGFILGIACTILAIIVGCVVSLFVYPFAITKSFKNPEINDYDVHIRMLGF